MRRASSSLAAMLAALLCGGLLDACAGTMKRADERAPSPRMVQVTSDVWVVANSSQSLFFCSGSNWLYASDRAWYQSNDFDGEFVVVASYSVPQPLLELERPERFAYAVDSTVRGQSGLVDSPVHAYPPTPNPDYISP